MSIPPLREVRRVGNRPPLRRVARFAAVVAALGLGLALGFLVGPEEEPVTSARVGAEPPDALDGVPEPCPADSASPDRAAAPDTGAEPEADSVPVARDAAPDSLDPLAGLTLVPGGVEIAEDSARALLLELRRRDLRVPVEGVEPGEVRDHFLDPRGGDRTHHAVDILAPRGRPVLAVEDGTIAHLDTAQAGGGTVVYQYGTEGRFVYYYAHLDAIAPGLEEGEPVRRGQRLGSVGITGNAPAGVPHLHFAIHLARPDGRWWRGTPLNPYAVLRPERALPTDDGP